MGVSLYSHAGHDRAGVSATARTVAALDVGSSKICCIIAEVRGFRRKRGDSLPVARITGLGVQAAQGVSGGVVVDADAAEKAVRLAVDAAERMAGTTIESILVNLSARPECTSLPAEMDVPGGGPVRRKHVDQLVSQALSHFHLPKREIVHVVPSGFSLDGGPWTPVAEGLHADRLKARVNVISVPRGSLRNLQMVLSRCMLEAPSFVLAVHAAARAVLVDDESALGAVVVDMGAETTGVGLYVGGRLEAAAQVPLGGMFVTRDLALGLGIPLQEAERIKTLHGSVLPGIDDDGEMLEVPMLGEEGAGAVQQVPRSLLGGIIRPRMEEILELVREQLDAAGAKKLGIARAVITGGASQIVGLRELAERILEMPVRIGKPRPFAGLPQEMETPAFSVVAGLLRSAIQPDGHRFLLPAEESESPRPEPAAALTGTEGKAARPGGYFSRMRAWLAESF
ncbi:cell division protein FtsA [Thermopetrobacter sp. TC1]|uniref:cell division protein FtsA n=1 Tax=Thermopetrobacter sp. TC1 TaxID=1495045 RepID=UPI00068A1F2C|nr:cell division protein FtsA [Thermopetrobacter sp. TC1]